jgi:ATP-binding cassette subfamily G (WHITE) protein 2 (PDR)
LYEGRQIYFGPVDEAAQYFVDLGFVRPNRATTADFLSSLTSPAERIAKEGYEDRVPRAPDEFAAAWKRSDGFRRLSNEIDKFGSAHPISGKEGKRAAVESGYVPQFHEILGAHLADLTSMVTP